MAKGFIDMTALTSALGAVRQGRKESLSPWHDQNLVEVTYLLLHDKMRVIPHPGNRGGEVGDVATFFSTLPQVTTAVKQSEERLAAQEADKWLKSNENMLATAWQSAKANQALWEWAYPQRDLRWVEQSQTYGGLFDRASIPYVAKFLPESEANIRRIFDMSTDPRHVRRWLKEGGEDADIAIKAWVLGWLIRGKYYEYLAKAADMQLVPHPLRKGLDDNLEVKATQNVRRSEEIFVNILVGSAQVESSAERRVRVLAENIERARKAIKAKALVLPDTITESEAETFAIRAAKDADIPSVARVYRGLTRGIIDVAAHSVLAYSLHPWVPSIELVAVINALAHLEYERQRGHDPGEDVAKLAFSTQSRFKWLAKLPSGRIGHETTPPTE